MNVILAVVLVAGIYMHGSKEPAYLDQPMVRLSFAGFNRAESGPAGRVDRIVKINGTSDPTWDRAFSELGSTLPGHSLSVVADRAGQQVFVSVPAGQSPEEMFGYPADHLVIASLTPGMPAERAGRSREGHHFPLSRYLLNSPIYGLLSRKHPGRKAKGRAKLLEGSVAGQKFHKRSGYEDVF